MTDQRKGDHAEPTTHFGYQDVPESQKAKKVAEVFHSVAAKYDLMNDVLSGGMHRLWKRFTIELSGVRSGNRVLDIAGGTGDLAAKFSRLVGPTGQVVLADINESMLKVGRDRLLDRGVSGNIEFVQADAEKLPFPDNHFDCVTIAFGLRNVTHKDAAIRSMLRVLKPGGRLLILEFSKPTNKLMSKAYDAYSFAFMPLAGKLITNDSESYRYLAESIRMHPDQETLKSMMVEAGFDRVTYHNMTSGIVAVHRGSSPDAPGRPARQRRARAQPCPAPDSTALPRLAALEGKVIEIDCVQPALKLFVLPDEEGLMLAAHWESEVDCTLRAPPGAWRSWRWPKTRPRCCTARRSSCMATAPCCSTCSASCRTWSWTGNTSCSVGWGRSPPH